MPKLKAQIRTQNHLILKLRDSSKKTSTLRFGFILGAGASSTSKIDTGSVLANKWYQEIKQSETLTEFQEWESKVFGKSKERDFAEHYKEIYEKRFKDRIQDGYEELQNIMEDARPSVGYSFLANLLTNSPHKFVLTTNFDTMTEDALFKIEKSRPLVIGHELLSNYINTMHPLRPTIIKIHRDIQFDPKNTINNTENIAIEWQDILIDILKDNHMIVLGYAGNDNSLMDYLKKVENKKPIYWCCRDKNKLSNKIINLLTEKDFIVEIKSFDLFMLMMNNELKYEQLVNHKNIHKSKIVANAISYAEDYKEQLNKLDTPELPKSEKNALHKLQSFNSLYKDNQNGENSFEQTKKQNAIFKVAQYIYRERKTFLVDRKKHIHRIIAKKLGISAETFSRKLTKLEEKKIINRKRKVIDEIALNYFLNTPM